MSTIDDILRFRPLIRLPAPDRGRATGLDPSFGPPGEKGRCRTLSAFSTMPCGASPLPSGRGQGEGAAGIPVSMFGCPATQRTKGAP